MSGRSSTTKPQTADETQRVDDAVDTTHEELADAAPDAEAQPSANRQTDVNEGAGAEKKAGSSAVKRPARRRTAKPDALIAESVDLAREALKEEFPKETIGEHTGVTVDDERVMTHRFTAEKEGYRGWEWYATLARAPRAKNVTVCELGLLPTDESVLAPPWVPWADRVRPEDSSDADEKDSAEKDGGEKDSAAAETGAEKPHEARTSADDSSTNAPAQQSTADGQREHAQDEGAHEEARAEGIASDDTADDDEPDLTAAEIEASVAVKRRQRRRRYRTRSTT